MLSKFSKNLSREFAGYNAAKFGQDCMAGLTVCAVALPLALAFGVSSGADAAAGLITAIIAGIVIGFLSGASYQISGPTGAMSAILITIVSRYGLQGVFAATLLAGIILLLCGCFKLGKLVGFIPAPVITGFTSGIAVIIILGQIDNFFGTSSQGDTAIAKLASYVSLGFVPNWQAVATGLLIVAIMIFWPKKWNEKVPSSLVAIIIAGIVSSVLKFDIVRVGTIPRTLFPENRLILSQFDFSMLKSLASPAITIAALGMIESLLCGASASQMKDESFDADQELVAQGIGNILMPFFGGVPATAAIARTSVAVKSGGQTRVTGIIHSLGLLASMFLLGGIMAQLPLAALAGVLMVTAFKMNDWVHIKYFFKHHFKGAMTKYLVTMGATVILDLTMAIVIGVIVSIFIFVGKASNISVTFSSTQKKDSADNETVTVAYITGPIFFTTTEKFKEAFTTLPIECRTLVISFRAVSTIDITGVEILEDLVKSLKAKGICVSFCGIQPRIEEYMNRSDIASLVGKEHLFFSVDQAIAGYQSKQ